MFVRRSKYRNALDTIYVMHRTQEVLLRSIFEMKNEVLKANASPQFTEAELRTIISLCHPDKHNNSKAATRITQKLLEIRQ